ncbi:MAG: hypothetical protein R3Y56_03130 [Akkermansia sp.]
MKRKHLSIKEKRDWLAGIFRDESGEFSQSEKFKAMVEDTRLAMLPEQKSSEPSKSGAIFPSLEILSHLPPPLKED